MKQKRLIIFLCMFYLFIIGICILIINIISPIPFMAFSKTSTGRVYDCTTGSPINNAKVTISGRGWGFSNGRLIWDKDYTRVTSSNLDGTFIINYTIGSSMTAEKEGFLTAEDYIENGQETEIGLLEDTNVAGKDKRTVKCKLTSECMKRVVKNGTEILYNSCEN